MKPDQMGETIEIDGTHRDNQSEIDEGDMYHLKILKEKSDNDDNDDDDDDNDDNDNDDNDDDHVSFYD